jgi:hypothetical protein
MIKRTIVLVLLIVLKSFNSASAKIIHINIQSQENIGSPEADFNISSQIVSETSFSDNYQTSDQRDEFKNTRERMRFVSQANYKGFFLKAFYALNEMRQASEESRRYQSKNGSGDRTFENHGASLRELVMGYDNDNFTVYAGKFSPAFAIAWRNGRGVFADQFADHYEQIEKLGFGGFAKLGDAKKNGAYNIGFSLFTNDRKNLDNSIITKRDGINKNNRAAGDTRSLTSYNITIDSNFDFGKGEKLSYRFSYLNLAQHNNIFAEKHKDEKKYSASMKYEYPLSNELSIDALAEFVKEKNIYYSDVMRNDISRAFNTINGFAGYKNNFTSSVVANIYNNWNITLSYSDVKYISQSSYNLILSEVSAGYKFKKTKLFDNLSIQAGHKNVRGSFREVNPVVDSAYVAVLRYSKLF